MNKCWNDPIIAKVLTEEFNSIIKDIMGSDVFTNSSTTSKEKKVTVSNAEAHINEDNSIVVYVNTPGCSKDSISVDITNDRTITVKYKYRDADKTATITVDKSQYDVNQVKAKYEFGQLTLTLNKIDITSSIKKVEIE